MEKVESGLWFRKICLQISFLLLCVVSNIKAQERCWNDKKPPKEYFIQCNLGYTISYGNQREYYTNQIRYSDRINNVYKSEDKNKIKTNDTEGIGGRIGIGVFLNKHFGLLLGAGFLWGRLVKTRIEVDIFSQDPFISFEDIKHYSYKEFRHYQYCSFDLSLGVIYRIPIGRSSLYSTLGFRYLWATRYSGFNRNEIDYLNGELMSNKNYGYENIEKMIYPNWDVTMGLGYTYPLSKKLELLTQLQMITKVYFPKYWRNTMIPDVSDGIELSTGIRYTFIQPQKIRP
jgi:hypothetical protein